MSTPDTGPGTLIYAVKKLPDLVQRGQGIRCSDWRNVNHNEAPKESKIRYLIVDRENDQDLPAGLFAETNLLPTAFDGDSAVLIAALGAATTFELHQIDSELHRGVIMNTADFRSEDDSVIFQIS